MKTSSDKHRSWMTAITFAEAGEWETAREMMPLPRQEKKIGWLQRMFMAITFAEAGMHEEALRLTDEGQPIVQEPGNFLDAVGLRGVRVTYGVLAVELG